MPSSISNKKPVTKLSGHKGVGGPQVSNVPPVPPGPGPVPTPFPILCSSLTVQNTASALTITGAPVACEGSHMQVDPPGNAPSTPTAGDIQTHAVTRNAVITSGASRCTADGRPVACTLDGVARNVMAPGQKCAQGPGKLMGAGGAATGGSGGGGGGGGSASAANASRAANASAGGAKGVASGAAGVGVGDGAGDSSNPKKGDQRRTTDPIDVLKGHVTQDETDLALPGLIALSVSRHYTSERRQRDSLLGHGWALSLERRIRRRGAVLALDMGDGREAYCEPVAVDEKWLHRRERLELHGRERGYDVYDVERRLTYRFEGSPDEAWLTAILDAWGNRVVFEYERGRLARVLDTGGRQLVLRLDAEGHLVRLEVWASPPLTEEEMAAGRQAEAPKLGQAIDYAYDDGCLVSVADALEYADRYDYDVARRMVAYTLKNGVTFHYLYDAEGRCYHSYGDRGLHTAELQWGDGEVFLNGTDEARRFEGTADGYTTLEESLDKQFQIIREYDDDRLLVSEANAAGETTTWTYDERGNLTEVVDPAGNTTRFEVVEDRIVARVDADGHTTRFQHEGHGSLISVESPTGATYQLAYDGRGRLSAVYSEAGLLYGFAYDSHHNLVERSDARGGTTRFGYDAIGRPVARTDAAGNETRVERNALGQPLAIHHPDGTSARATFDSLGKIASFVDALGQETKLRHQGTGVLAELTEPSGQRWKFEYDRDERLTRIQNPRYENYDFAYDRMGRVTTEQPFDGRTLSYRYDRAGRLSELEQPEGARDISAPVIRRFRYDKLGGLLEEADAHCVTALVRDKQSRIVAATLTDATGVAETHFERDAFGRVVAETQDGLTLRYGRDARGRIISRTLPAEAGGGETTYAYDAQGAVSDIVHDGHAVRVERDRLGRELSRKSGDLLLEHHYDALDRLLEQRLTHTTGAVDRSTGAAPALVQRNYRYDASGRLAELKDTRWGRTQYRHDPIGQLVSVVSDRHQEAFDYDVTGSLQNVLSRLEDASQTTPWRVGKGNLLEERPGAEPGSRILYENDTAGRRTRKTECAADGTTATTTYHYDHGGRLREVRLPDSSIARYRYDAFTRRIEKKLIPKERADVARAFVITAVTGTAPTLPTTTRFVYDGGALCAELRRDGATGALTAERVHVHLPKSLTPLLQIEGGQLYTVITDHLGAPRELVDTHGRIAWTAHCSGWGNLLAETREPNAAAVRSPFRLLGQYDDEETGLCYTRFRYFDAHTARWLTPDPLGFDGGRNLLAFDGSPVVEVDPWGLACEKGQEHARLPKYLRNKMKHIKNQTAAGGMQGISGHVSESEADRLGVAWVGPGYRESQLPDGSRIYISEDEKRQYRPPSPKRGINPATMEPWSSTGSQANFESRPAPAGRWTNNVHLDVDQ